MIKISNIKKVFSSYVSTPNSTKTDFITGFIALVFFYLCWSFYIPLSETGKYTTDIELGYSAKQDEEGYYYVVDSGHNRLICFDEDSNIQYEIDNVSDNESNGLYISDFCVDNGLIYMSVGEWNGMLLSKEAILVFDKEKYVEEKGLVMDSNEDELKSIVEKVIADNRRLITPYTIGYWYSLDNTYEVLEDKAEIQVDAKSFMLPPPPMDNDGHILPPEKSMPKFFNIVRKINNDYNLFNDISRSNRNEFITEYYKLLKETHGEGSQYNTRLQELYDEYCPNKYDNNNLREAIEEYLDEYESYFNYRLPNVYEFTRRCNVKIAKVV